MYITILLLLVFLSKEMLEAHKIHLAYIFFIGHKLQHHKQQLLHLHHHLLPDIFIAHHCLQGFTYINRSVLPRDMQSRRPFPQYKQVTWANSYNQYLVDLKVESTLSNSPDPVLHFHTVLFSLFFSLLSVIPNSEVQCSC